MPCDSGYLAPRGDEIASKETAQNLVYVLKALHREIPEWIRSASEHLYGAPRQLNELVVLLCELCTNMTHQEQNRIIYDGKNKQARQLADWWDEHLEADRKRIEKKKLKP